MSGEPQPRLLWIEEHPSARERRVGRLRESALTVGALSGVLCLLLAVVAVAFDVRPVVFQSGSMSPAIETGALGIARTVPASELATGDVVTVQTPAGVNVTHRIQNLTIDAQGRAVLVLKGDANGAPDEMPYVVSSAPRIVADVPQLGYVAAFLSGTPGTFLGGLLVGIVLLVAVRGDRSRPGRRRFLETDADGAPHRTGARATAVAVGVVATLAAVALPSTPTTQAFYSDTATLTSGTFARQAPAPVAPTIATCTRSGGEITITWNAVAGATSYTVSWTNPSGTASTTATSFTPNANFNIGGATGQISVRAVNAAGTSAPSGAFGYTGNGNNAPCTRL